MGLTIRQTEILDSAARLIAEGGMQRFTLRRVAAELGVTEPAIYRHFSSKHEILKAMLQRFSEGSLTGLLDVQSRSADILASLQQFLANLFSSLKLRPEMSALLFAEGMFRYDDKLADVVLRRMKKTQHRLTALLARGQQLGQIRSDVEAENLALVVQGTTRLLGNKWHLSGQESDISKDGLALADSLSKLLARS